MGTTGRPAPLRVRDPERGSLTLFAVVLALGLLAMAGLVIDGGAQLTAQRRAEEKPPPARGSAAVSYPGRNPLRRSCAGS